MHEKYNNINNIIIKIKNERFAFLLQIFHSLEENPEDLVITEGKIVQETIKDKSFEEYSNKLLCMI